MKFFRKRAGLGQAKLASLMLCSDDTVARWEKGSSQPRADQINRLCEIFEISEQELLSWSQETSSLTIRFIGSVGSLEDLGVAKTNVINWGLVAKTGAISFAGQINAEITPETPLKEIRQKANEICQRLCKEMTATLVGQQAASKALIRELDSDKRKAKKAEAKSNVSDTNA